MLRQLLKYRDYKMALQMIDYLSLKQYTPQVYEDWCQTMVKFSTLTDSDLELRLQEKFDQLKIQLAEDQGISTSTYQFQMGGNFAAQ